MSTERPRRLSPREKGQQVFGVEGASHEIAEKYEPSYLTRGGEHIVYEIPGHPGVVAKAAIDPLIHFANWNRNHGRPMDERPSGERFERVENALTEEKTRYTALREAFGTEHVPNQKVFFLNVPMTGALWQAAATQYSAPAEGYPASAWTLVRIQERVVAVTDRNRVPLISGYAEQGIDTASPAYRHVSENLLVRPHQSQVSKEDFLSVQGTEDEELSEILSLAETDPSFKQMLTDLVHKTIVFAQRTNEILDLAGTDNVILHKDPQSGRWTYTLIDALYPMHPEILSEAKRIVSSFENKLRSIHRDDWNVLLNVFNFIRTINGLADHLGVSERIVLFDSDHQWKNFLTLLR